MAGADDREIRAIERPHPKLRTYFLWSSLITGPAFPIVFLVRLAKYRTLRYRFDDEGISARWGMLFRREVHLTYARIQDIHLRSNVVERWLGLARLEIQTASGSAKAEMTIMGVMEFEPLRNFIYARMRGARRPAASDGLGPDPGGVPAELASLLHAVAEELREIRTAMREGSDGG